MLIEGIADPSASRRSGRDANFCLYQGTTFVVP